MITMENKGNNTMTKMMECGAVKIGRNISATRHDGRVFEGSIVNARAYDKGTLVTIQAEEKYKNVYLEDCTGWVVWENTGNEMYWKGE